MYTEGCIKLIFPTLPQDPYIISRTKALTRTLKKNLVKAFNPQVDALYFFDEARFGTHSKLGHGWFQKGVRTPVKVKLGFQNFYAYSAASPIDGDDFTLIQPKVNTQCMNIFLSEMSTHLGEKCAILVMDCAAWHRSKDLIVPANIQIMYLPPYSPELNPVERLWQHLKSNTIRNKVYETIEDLEDTVCAFICRFEKDVIKGICSANYLLN